MLPARPPPSRSSSSRSRSPCSSQRTSSSAEGGGTMPRLALRSLALGYLGLLLVLPLGMVGWRTLEHGPGPVWDALSRPAFIHALWLTILITLIAVPANTIFGVVCALAIVRRGSARGNSLLNAVIGLPLADRKSTRLNSSHVAISYAVFC